MHRTLRSTSSPLSALLPSLSLRNGSHFTSLANTAHRLPNEPMNLDPSLKALLKDADISLDRHKRFKDTRPPMRELETVQVRPSYVPTTKAEFEEEDMDHRLERKSPAAIFGSDSPGVIVLPAELQASIRMLIDESSNKRQVHNDAKRLFMDEKDGLETGWSSHYDARYRSRRKRDLLADRDGTAFASVALPSHYAAISSVLSHVKHRLGPAWQVRQVIEWGTGVGAGLWASLHTLQKADISTLDGDLRIANTSLEKYVAIDKRQGLTDTGRRLFQHADTHQSLSMNWQKAVHDSDVALGTVRRDLVALSAFSLSSLSSDVARKTRIKEMWQSGAEVMILIDHNSVAGFEAIAEARADLLKIGKREIQDIATEGWDVQGCHVVAPCPHDGACPLFRTGSTHLVCGFEQRLQRPDFVRLTKHSKIGHEDIGYSYVVVRRGTRPAANSTKVGRLGEVGRRAAESELLKRAPRELSLHDESEPSPSDIESGAENHAITVTLPDEGTPAEVAEKLRLEAYYWPRLVFPPLKKSGHIILDSCTPEGEIMRITIPRSQGKQPFYDARKSQWGDIFPHAPKNAPQIRVQHSKTKGQDIGKRRESKKELKGSKWHRRNDRRAYKHRQDKDIITED